MIRVFGITLKCYLSRLSIWQSKHKTCYTLSMSRMTNKCYTRRAIIILVLVVLWPSCYSCYTRYLCYFWKLYSISCYCAILLPVVLSLDIFWLSCTCYLRYSAIKCVNYLKPAWAWDLSPTGRYRSPFVICYCVSGKLDDVTHTNGAGPEWWAIWSQVKKLP